MVLFFTEREEVLLHFSEVSDVAAAWTHAGSCFTARCRHRRWNIVKTHQREGKHFTSRAIAIITLSLEMSQFARLIDFTDQGNLTMVHAVVV